MILAADLLHEEEDVVYGDGGYQGLEGGEEMAGRIVECRVAMGSGQRRKLSESPAGQREEWYEHAQTHPGAKVEHAFPVMKQQFGLDKTRLRDMGKNHREVVILAALTNLFIVRKKVLSIQGA